MADVAKTRTLLQAREEMQKVIKFNADKKPGQYKYIYIVSLSDGYMVRLGKEKPTAKNVHYKNKLW